MRPAERSFGILLHISSLPSNKNIGDFGPQAYKFIDWLKSSGAGFWQFLPLHPPGANNSPYQALSVFALNPAFISLELLQDEGILPENSGSFSSQEDGLRTAFLLFTKGKVSAEIKSAYLSFLEQESYWIHDFAGFMQQHDQNQDEDEEYHSFIQFCAFRQFQKLKTYAGEQGISLIGDIPIYCAHDSADVSAHRKLFKLDDQGNPAFLAGVPPDYFSATGQLWGNPVYDWDKMKEDSYQWWIQRIKCAMKTCDLLRLDHFRGFESYWEVPAGAETAARGHWEKGPGRPFFQALQSELGKQLPLIAEDLGVITDEVKELRDCFQFPRMIVLQFAFAEGAEEYLTHNHKKNSFLYTATHDNDTTRGWYESQDDKRTAERIKALKYCNLPDDCSGVQFTRALIHEAFKSRARVVILPMQDVLMLPSDARMNTPGTAENQWKWQLDRNFPKEESARFLLELAGLFQRI